MEGLTCGAGVWCRLTWSREAWDLTTKGNRNVLHIASNTQKEGEAGMPCLRSWIKAWAHHLFFPLKKRERFTLRTWVIVTPSYREGWVVGLFEDWGIFCRIESPPTSHPACLSAFLPSFFPYFHSRMPMWTRPWCFHNRMVQILLLYSFQSTIQYREVDIK